MLPVTALETGFPARTVDAAAQQESWRKEVHRPATHTHKWWAQRLGSVFRGLLVSALCGTEEEAAAAYAGPTRAPGLVVLDPFAGSGTTLVEALKLGCRVVGQDINPVATLVQRQAVAAWDRAALDAAYKEVEAAARTEVDALHVTAAGEPVLYYFWVALAGCPRCPRTAPPVELFSSYVFAKHAYPKRFPRAQATCPACRAVVPVDLTQDQAVDCPACGARSGFAGPVSGAWLTCPSGHRTRIVEALAGERPRHRMYAKLVLGADGAKRYAPVDAFDHDLYAASGDLLRSRSADLVLPAGVLEPGHNTRQAGAWGFRAWRDFFNDRQLLSLGLIGAAVRDLTPGPEREALAALFSGTLEFNNLFCSYKGEGTGAVRHMFAHHVLRPQRTPLEAHPWGTPASSGSFSTLYASRLLRALDYKAAPYDIVGGARVSGLGAPCAAPIVASGAGLLARGAPAALLATGSSARLDLPDACVDVVLTDPPFLDNVHYSELADFFHAWLAGIRPYEGYPATATTRAAGEVQAADPAAFGAAIGAVWREVARVLRPDGLLAFTFHQAKPAAWCELMAALRGAGLAVTAVQPVKAEMSTSSPKAGAADPSNLDAVVVCRPAAQGNRARPDVDRVVAALRDALDAGIEVGYADVQSVVRGAVLAAHTWPGADPDLSGLAALSAARADAACAALGLASRRPRPDA